MQHFPEGDLRYDRYRSLSWNLDFWFCQARAADAQAQFGGKGYTYSLLRGLTAAYLDLLGDAYPVLAPDHVWDACGSCGGSRIGACDVGVSLAPTADEIAAFAGAPAVNPRLIVTIDRAEDFPQANAGVCTVQQLIAGHALRNRVMDGMLWRPCLSKLVQAYDFLVDSQCLCAGRSLRIVDADK